MVWWVSVMHPRGFGLVFGLESPRGLKSSGFPLGLDTKSLSLALAFVLVFALALFFASYRP